MAKVLQPDFIGSTPVIPVITIHELEHAIPMARALVSGGLRVLEVTLRTPVALAAIAAIARDVPEALVGAGTILAPSQIDEVAKAGGRFCVTPGSTAPILARASDAGMPLLPGAVTASEIMALLEWGVQMIKFYPAESSGGVAALKAFAGPFFNVRFCPTGGIDLSSAPGYLALKNVACVGGTWLTPPELLKGMQWREIQARASQAFGLRVS